MATTEFSAEPETGDTGNTGVTGDAGEGGGGGNSGVTSAGDGSGGSGGSGGPGGNGGGTGGNGGGGGPAGGSGPYAGATIEGGQNTTSGSGGSAAHDSSGSSPQAAYGGSGGGRAASSASAQTEGAGGTWETLCLDCADGGDMVNSSAWTLQPPASRSTQDEPSASTFDPVSASFLSALLLLLWVVKVRHIVRGALARSTSPDRRS